MNAAADLGSPSIGTFAIEGSPATYGFISAGVDRAFTTGNDANTRNTIPAANGPLGTAFEASAGTSFGGTAATNRLYANFAPANITNGYGAVTTFDVGAFGTQNSGAFKALNVRGLSSGGDEVFEAWIGFGSGNGTRFVYAREAGDTTYLRTASTAGTPAGTLVYDNIGGGWIGTNNTSKPGGLETLTISVLDGLVTYGLSGGTAGSTLTFGQNSAATDLSQLEFSSVNFNQGGNSGFWLDNLTVVAVPEPSSIALVGLAGLGYVVRRRRRA
ncbi:PEP-CTERM sorting domain-containing protein [Rubripirellula tenax]|uniref:PEP-CTERM sorting domain-containing protein n=1 Tax=Rubripirellula tenax TaxID=2528015 RepID=UPI0016486030|nr:PEP-CTERM sorting domain-containing protein [Rubripirellula tenax]